MEWRWIVCVVLLGMNAISDLLRKEILLIPTAAAASAGFVWRIFLLHFAAPELLWSVIPGGILLMTACLTNGKIGVGDGLLIIAAGTWIGFPEIMYIVCIALIMASAGGAVLFAVRAGAGRKEYRSGKSIEMPFVPYLFASSIIVWFALR